MITTKKEDNISWTKEKDDTTNAYQNKKEDCTFVIIEQNNEILFFEKHIDKSLDNMTQVDYQKR